MPAKLKKNKLKKISKLNPLLNSQFRILKVAVLALVLLIGYIFLLQPKFTDLSQDRSIMLGQQEVELEGLKKYSVALHELELITDEFKRTQAANMDKLAQILPTQAELPDLIVQMEAIALASSFRLTSIDITHGLPQERSQAKSVGKKGESETIDATEINPAVKVLNISLSVEGGDYPELKELLGNIEKHLRIMDVTGISFSSGLEVSGYDIPIRTYYYEPDL